MPNRVIKDSIWSSPTLAKLPLDVQLHWPRWLLMADDWGCFNADPDVIKGLVYPKAPTITIRKICDLLKGYADAGLLFLWNTGERMWGFFTSWHGHQFCNATHLGEDGKQLRHQRKTPEPPEKELSAYLAHHNQITQVVGGKLEHVRAVQNKYRNPNPNPNPNPSSTVGASPSAEGASPTPLPSNGWGTPESLMALYNEACPPECPAAETLSPKRREKAKRLLRAFPEKAYWQDAFREVHKSPFLRGMCAPGKGHSKAFVASFDWLLSCGKDGTENIVQVWERKYGNQT